MEGGFPDRLSCHTPSAHDHLVSVSAGDSVPIQPNREEMNQPAWPGNNWPGVPTTQRTAPC